MSSDQSIFERPLTLWLIGLGLPVIYALSIGPIAALDSFNVFSASQLEYIDDFYMPLDWCSRKLSMESVLAHYVGWWQEIFHR